MITGGADSATNPLTVASFGAAGMVPKTNGDDPSKVSRSFDRKRQGGIMAEGAGVVILERSESALARGAKPYLEIVAAANAVDPAGPEHVGEGLREAMIRAMANACLLPQSVDHVCAHGPSDVALDRVETAMIKDALGDRAYRVPVVSIKGATGNPLSAAGPRAGNLCAQHPTPCRAAHDQLRVPGL